MIYQLNGKYGLLHNASSRTKARFDTLVYVKGINAHLYLTGKIDANSKKWKFGIINESEKIVVPIEYDCLFPNLPILNWTYYQKYFDAQLDYNTVVMSEYTLDKNNRSFTIGEFGLMGLKNGKVGIISLENKLIFPIKYDAFFRNKMDYTHPVRSKGYPIIVKKGGWYAATENLSITAGALDKKFLFPYPPISYYPNYGKKEGFNLVNLVDKKGIFCYAREDGFLYYKEE